MKKISILVVAPYPEFGELAVDIAKAYPQINVYVAPGIYQNAIEYTQIYPSKKFDCIISRSFTADLLRETSITPVIDVELSFFDAYRTIQIASSIGQKFAVLSTPPVIEVYHQLAELLHIDLNLYTFHNVSQVEGLLKKIKRSGYNYVIAGLVAEEIAPRVDIKTIRIASSRDSIEAAVKKSLEIYDYIERAGNTSDIFLSFIDYSKDGVIIYNDSEKMVYVNIAIRNENMFAPARKLEQYIQYLREENEMRIIKRIDQFYWEIDGRKIEHEDTFFYAFHLRKLYSYAQSKKEAFIRMEDAEDIYKGFSNIIWNGIYREYLGSSVQAAIDSYTPVLITGEVGTGKTELTQYIYCHSQHKKAPLITIDCKELTRKSWNTLINNDKNPFHDVGYSILFDDISCLHPSLQRELNDYIEGTNMARRHRLYATSSVDLAHLVKNNQFSLPLYRSFCGFTINLKPLALTPELILPLAAEILEWISKKFSKDCGGFEDEAKVLLQEFPWPLNIIQLVAVLQQLVINSDGFIITTELTKQVLDKETPKEYVPSTMFDLTKPLAEIEQDVIMYVLRESNMNHSLAAKRLGIGRSTLWRKITNQQ